MRWMIFVAAAAVAIARWLPGEAAQPSPAAADTDPVTFEQYRDWRNAYIERRRTDIELQLSGQDLPAERKKRLEQVKAYYDWFAGLSDADRDRRFRERFNRIDTDHDGTIDAAERASWRDKQRAFYRSPGLRQPAAAGEER